MHKFLSIVFVLIALITAVQPVEACDPTPPSSSYVECNDLGSGYQYGFRVKYARNGTYRFTSSYGTLTGGAPKDWDNYVKIFDSNGYVFDWRASMGIDAVIVNAGGRSRVIKDAEDNDGYNYYGKTDYRGRPYKITSVEFCYDYELSVSKTAEGIAESGSSWEITKNVAVPHQEKFAGEMASFDYTVGVTKVTTGESGYRVRGEVVIENNTPAAAYISYIKDYLKPGDTYVKLDCGKNFPYKLYPGKTLTCTYDKELDSKLEGKNTVKVYTKYDTVSGGYAEAPIVWTTQDGGTGPSTVTVIDTQAGFGEPRTVSESTTWTYAVEAACPADPALYTDGKLTTLVDNTATIAETKQSATANAVLDCYLPSVTQSNNTSLDLQHKWDIVKLGSTDDLILDLEQTLPVDYTVTVNAYDAVEVNQKVTGSVTLTNPHPSADLTGTLTAEPVPGQAATLVDCAPQVTIPAGGSITCGYEAPLASSVSGTNTASFAFNNLAVVNTTTYSFDAATRGEIDECVTVVDDKYGPLGEVCASDAPKQFDYTMEVGGLTVCQSDQFSNTATFTTNDTGTQGTSTWTVQLQAECTTSPCLYILEYWVEHAYPENYNTTWDMVGPQGPASPFYETGTTWLQMMNTVPGYDTDPRESTYIALARNYMVAKLNQLQGTEMPQEVLIALITAEAYLEEYDTDRSAIDDITLQEMYSLYEVLNMYSNGGYGQEVCCW